METIARLLRDIRFALRQLRRAPVYSAAVVGTVALAVGATAAMSGVLRATLLHRLPYPRPDQLVEAKDQNLRGFKTRGLMSVLRIEDLAQLEHNGHRVFSSVGFFYSDDLALTLDAASSVRVPATAVSGTFFSTVGAPALLGRTLTPADDVPNGPQVVVLSYRLWQSTFGGDPRVLGRSVRLSADQATVVGVMPPQFDLPNGTELWHPGHIFPQFFGSYRGDGSRFLEVIARLDAHESLAGARRATSELATRLAKQYPDTDGAWGFVLTDLRSGLFGAYQQALLLVAAAVALVLLAAAVNLAGLQLSRNAARQQELAVRSALGLTRSRLAQMLAVEALTPALLGGALGVVLAAALLGVVVTHLPAGLVIIERPRVDLAVLGASFVTALAVGLFTAALPLLQNRDQGRSSSDQHFAGLGAGRGVVGRARRLGRLLSALQIALTLVLLTLSGAVLLHLYRLLNTPLGFDLSHLETFTVDLPWGTDPAKLHRLYAQLEQDFAALPGVESAGAETMLPLASFSMRNQFDVAGRAPTPDHDAVVAEARDLSPGYLHTLHVPLLRGRNFTTRDAAAGAPPVLLINRTLAERYFAGDDPVGKHFLGVTGVGADAKLRDAGEIVGVLGDVRGTGGNLEDATQPEVYRPENGGWPHLQFALRTDASLRADDPLFQARIRSIVTAADSTASPGHFTSLAGTLGRALLEPRLNAALLAGFAGLALLLAVIGVYGLVAFDVAERTSEVALRLALGSTRWGVLRLLLAESGRMLVLGLAAGLAASWAAARTLEHAAGALPLNPGTLVGRGNTASSEAVLFCCAAAVLSAAVLSATLFPARRAAAVDPMQALRAE